MLAHTYLSQYLEGFGISTPDSDVDDTLHDNVMEFDLDNNASVEEYDDDEYVTDSDNQDDDDVDTELPTNQLLGARLRTGVSGETSDVSGVLRT